jgi:hypothetical protein
MLYSSYAVGDVPCGSSNETHARRQSGIPLQPANGTVAADVSVLELVEFFAAIYPLQRRACALPILAMHELEAGPGNELLGRVSEGALERPIDPLEVSVSRHDAH